jgi:uncharacterized protein
MPTERFEFPGTKGQKLAARLDTPTSAPRAFALFGHCFTCGKDNIAASRIAHALSAHGIAVLRFDFTGIGSSEGDFADTNFSSNCQDLVAAANHLRSAYVGPALLIGHSLGGAAVLASASRIQEARAIVTIAAPSNPSHVTGHFAAHLDQIRSEGEAPVDLGGRILTIKQQFINDVANHRLAEVIAQLRLPLMVMHAPRDSTVGIENANAIFSAAKHPKSFVSLDDADHLITRQSDAVHVANVIAAWSSGYIDSI